MPASTRQITLSDLIPDAVFALEAVPTRGAISGQVTIAGGGPPTGFYVSAYGANGSGYDYADAHLGLELGRRRVTFYLHGGLTRVTGHVRNLDQTTGGADGSGDVSVSFTRDPSVTLTTLSARLGLVVYIR